MANVKLIITICDGNLQSVLSTQPVDYLLIDKDIIGKGEQYINMYEPDGTFKEGEAYMMYTNASDPVEMEIRDELKRIHF